MWSNRQVFLLISGFISGIVLMSYIITLGGHGLLWFTVYRFQND